MWCLMILEAKVLYHRNQSKHNFYDHKKTQSVMICGITWIRPSSMLTEIPADRWKLLTDPINIWYRLFRQQTSVRKYVISHIRFIYTESIVSQLCHKSRLSPLQQIYINFPTFLTVIYTYLQFVTRGEHLRGHSTLIWLDE